MTVTSAVVTTVTNIVTVTDTIARIVIVASTINSVVEVTVTGVAGTETDWTYVTATAFDKRWLPSAPPQHLHLVIETGEARLPGQGSEDVGDHGLPPEQLADQATLLARQNSVDPSAATAATTTITEVVTQTTDITSAIHATITTDSSSVSLMTMYQTNTRYA